MICEKCHTKLSRFRSLAHRCKPEVKKVFSMESIVSSSDEAYGVGPSWAPTEYANYYATSSLIYSAVKIRSSAITRPPLLVYQNRDNPTPVGEGHPLQILLDKVNDWWTGRDLWEATSTYLDLWGSAFWILKKTSPLAPPTEIWLYRPDKMRVLGDRATYIRGFVYHEERGETFFPPEEVVWLKNFNPLSEFSGFSPLAPSRLSADTAMLSMRHNAAVFKNGVLSDTGILSEDAVTDEQVEEILARIKARHSGVENSHNPTILGGIKDIKNLGLSPKDMEFLGSLRWSLEDIARVFGVPKILLQDLERSTYENVNAAERLFWRNTVIPQLKFLEAELNEMLVPQFGDDSIFVEFDLSDIEAIQEDENAVALRQQNDITKGIITINEARQERNLPPVPWGDAFWVSNMLVPVTDDKPPEPPQSEPQPADNASVTQEAWKLYRPQLKAGVLADEHLSEIADMHSKRLDRHTGRYVSLMHTLFAQQRKDALIKLRALPRAINGTETKVAVSTAIFTPEDWQGLFISLGAPLLSAILVDSANASIENFHLGIAFNLNDGRAQRWLGERLSFWAEQVNEETARLLVQELQEGERLGESIRDLQVRVEKVFNFSDSVRSERIARTEIQSATNRGSLEAYKQSGVVEKKMWLASIDGRERESHAEANRQVVPIDEPFIVGGSMMDSPGDTGAPPGETINCRCTTVPIVEPARRNIAIPQVVPDNIARLESSLRSEFALLAAELENKITPLMGRTKKVKRIIWNDSGDPESIIEESIDA
jgi:HK97 family phage portal protein